MTTLSTATDTTIRLFFEQIKNVFITHDVVTRTISMVSTPDNDGLCITEDRTQWFDNTPAFQAQLFGCANLAYCGVRKTYNVPEDWYVDAFIIEKLAAQKKQLDYNHRVLSDIVADPFI